PAAVDCARQGFLRRVRSSRVSGGASRRQRLGRRRSGTDAGQIYRVLRDRFFSASIPQDAINLSRFVDSASIPQDAINLSSVWAGGEAGQIYRVLGDGSRVDEVANTGG